MVVRSVSKFRMICANSLWRTAGKILASKWEEESNAERCGARLADYDATSNYITSVILVSMKNELCFS